MNANAIQLYLCFNFFILYYLPTDYLITEDNLICRKNVFLILFMEHSLLALFIMLFFFVYEKNYLFWSILFLYFSLISLLALQTWKRVKNKLFIYQVLMK